MSEYRPPYQINWRMVEMTERRVVQYILDGHTPVPAPDPRTWADWMMRTSKRRNRDRRVALSFLRLPRSNERVRISTVFLGHDQSITNEGWPILFESRVFGGPLDDEWERYSTWDEAEIGHRVMVARVRAALRA